MGALAEAQKRGHETVAYFHFPEVGLRAIVAIHSTVLGPALGGCRMRAYRNEEEALDDVMRLSEGMTYKSAVAGMDLGGGKACIIADPKVSVGRDALFKKFGECLNQMGGTYVTAEDMGTNVTDMTTVFSVSKFVTGIDPSQGGGGDPSPWTAQGVFDSMQAASDLRFGKRDLSGRRVAMQGVGHVGVHVLEHLCKAGAKVTVCDTNEVAARQVAAQFGVEVVPPDGIYDVPCDIFSPCAVGQTINERTLTRLNCAIIAGAANNQLTDQSVYSLIMKRGILYCPDFVINCGGVISVGAELNKGGWKKEWVAEKVSRIGTTIRQILETADQQQRFPELVAIDVAKERINAARKK